MTVIRDVVSEMSVTNESNISTFGHSMDSSVPAIRESFVPDARLVTTGEAADMRLAAGVSLLQIEDMRKSLRDMEKHVCIPDLLHFLDYFEN